MTPDEFLREWIDPALDRPAQQAARHDFLALLSAARREGASQQQTLIHEALKMRFGIYGTPTPKWVLEAIGEVLAALPLDEPAGRGEGDGG